MGERRLVKGVVAWPCVPSNTPCSPQTPCARNPNPPPASHPAPRSTVPFVAKAIGHPVVKYASLLMSGKTLAEINFTEEPVINHVCVKEVVVPWRKFAGAPVVVARGRGAGCTCVVH